MHSRAPWCMITILYNKIKFQIKGGELTMYTYFKKTELDNEFFIAHLQDRMPEQIIDAHAHFNRPEHVSNVSKEAIAGDWALECGLIMTFEDACSYTKIMFPDISWDFVALPWPLRDADTQANNDYISGLIKNDLLRGLYTLRPEYEISKIEQDYLGGLFSGFKPYPYMANATKGADISIFDFMPHEQFNLANELGATVLMHLPRAGRLPDPDNIAEIKTIVHQYPNIKLVLAHFGRCFQESYLKEGLDALGTDVNKVWFDCSAVLNPDIYRLAFKQIDHQRILFGTDLPIFLWHGKRVWDKSGYHNLCREDFSWNAHDDKEHENEYTFFVYEQINNILNSLGKQSNSIKSIFCENAKYVYKRK